MKSIFFFVGGGRELRGSNPGVPLGRRRRHHHHHHRRLGTMYPCMPSSYCATTLGWGLPQPAVVHPALKLGR